MDSACDGHGLCPKPLALGGGAFVLTGVAGLLMAQLTFTAFRFPTTVDVTLYLSGWRQEPYLIHNSTALLGPAFVEFFARRPLTRNTSMRSSKRWVHPLNPL